MVIQLVLILLAFYSLKAEQSAMMISSMITHVLQLAVIWVTLHAKAGFLVIIGARSQACR